MGRQHTAFPLCPRARGGLLRRDVRGSGVSPARVPAPLLFLCSRPRGGTGPPRSFAGAPKPSPGRSGTRPGRVLRERPEAGAPPEPPPRAQAHVSETLEEAASRPGRNARVLNVAGLHAGSCTHASPNRRLRPRRRPDFHLVNVSYTALRFVHLKEKQMCQEGPLPFRPRSFQEHLGEAASTSATPLPSV